MPKRETGPASIPPELIAQTQTVLDRGTLSGRIDYDMNDERRRVSFTREGIFDVESGGRGVFSMARFWSAELAGKNIFLHQLSLEGRPGQSDRKLILTQTNGAITEISTASLRSVREIEERHLSGGGVLVPNMYIPVDLLNAFTTEPDWTKIVPPAGWGALVKLDRTPRQLARAGRSTIPFTFVRFSPYEVPTEDASGEKLAREYKRQGAGVVVGERKLTIHDGVILNRASHMPIPRRIYIPDETLPPPTTPFTFGVYRG